MICSCWRTAKGMARSSCTKRKRTSFLCSPAQLRCWSAELCIMLKRLPLTKSATERSKAAAKASCRRRGANRGEHAAPDAARGLKGIHLFCRKDQGILAGAAVETYIKE